MTKKILFLCAIACFFTVFSCSDNNVSNLDSAYQNEGKTENTLQSYNISISGEWTDYSKMDNIGNLRREKAIRVAMADIRGFAFYLDEGAEIYGDGPTGSAAASAMAGNSTSWNDPNGDPLDMDNDNFNVLYDVPSLFSSFDIGDDHNNILNSLMTTESSIEEIATAYYNEEVAQYYVSLVETNQLVEEITTAYVNSDYNIEVLFENNLLSVSLGNILQTFFEGLSVCESDQQLSDIIAFYSETVIESDDLTVNEKQSLIGAFSIARSSINYWYFYAE